MIGSQNLVTTIKNFSFRKADKLGKGSTGSVYLGSDNLTGNRVAIKVIDMKDINNEVTRYLLGSQKNALSGLNHPNIIKCLDIIDQKNHCYIVTEYCQEGTLADHIKKRGGRLSQEEAMTILKGIVSGCKSFHERGVVHRDLKPSNILMKAGVPKVSDFGYCEITGGKKPRVYYNVGSPSYMPPEAYIKNYYSEKSDVWGVGMIYYEMLKGSTLDKGKEVSETYNFIRTGGRFVPPGVSPQSERILLECIKFDFNKRISFKDLDRLVNGQSLVQTNDTVVNGPERNNQLINGLNGQNVNATNKQQLGRTLLGSVKSYTQTRSIGKPAAKTPVFKDEASRKNLLNITSNNLVHNQNKTIEIQNDVLNMTDPSIRRSFLSDKPSKKIEVIPKIQMKQSNHNVLKQFTAPSAIEPARFITQRAPQNGVSSVAVPPNKITKVDAALFGQKKVPFQTIANTPRYFHHQPDTVTVYRHF